MAVEITEFVEIDPDSVHAVFKAANGTPFLMIKQIADGDADDKPEEDEEPDKDGKATKELQFCGDPTCEICIGRAAKGKLSTAERRSMPKGDFAIPDKAPGSGSYPVNDRAHARNALSRVSQHGTPEEKARVRRAVASKFPTIGRGKKEKRQLRKALGSQQEVQDSFHGQNPPASAQMGQTTKNKRGLATNKDVQRAVGKPNIPDVGTINGEGDGRGDTQENKDIHKDEGLIQTSARVAEQQGRQVASKARDGMQHDMHEGRGDTNPEDVPVVGDTATGPLQTQTEGNQRKQSKGGSSNQMALQAGQAQKGFKFKVKKTGKKKRKKNAPHELVGALKQSDPQRVLSVANATKELDDMTGAEFAQTLIETLDARDARKAEDRKAKKAKKAKKEKKARKAGAAKRGTEKVASDATKSVSPEMLVEGVADRVSEAMKQALKPIIDDVENLKNQPARVRPALNNLAGNKPEMRDQAKKAGDGPMDHLAPLEAMFKAEQDPYKKEKLGGELTKARLVIRERLSLGQPVTQADAEALVAATQ